MNVENIDIFTIENEFVLLLELDCKNGFIRLLNNSHNILNEI
jgi:hypothetical protein